VKAIVTGANGFAGRHLVQHLRDRGDTVIAAGHGAEVEIDLRFVEDVKSLVAQAQPDVIFHLAGTSSVTEVQRDPVSGNQNVVQPALNMLEAVVTEAVHARVLLVSTCHVYGRPSRLPIDEAAPLAPVDLYGGARAAVEYMVASYRARGAQVVIARAFHHTGPGQDRRFAVAGWAARAAAGEARIPVGDLSLRRDYSDVRDIVAGYALLAEQGQPGEAYNLCSGRAVALSELFALAAPGAIPVPDAARVRRNDPPALLGTAARAEALGWTRRFALEGTIADLRASFVAAS
jgi:GDP-4-dehydro-6-deoxy-D-mannose reductase